MFLRSAMATGAILLLGASSAAAAEIEARGQWFDSSDGTSGGITLRFEPGGGPVSGNLRQTGTTSCTLVDEAGEPAEVVTVTLSLRGSITGALLGGKLDGTWNIDNSDVTVTGDPRCRFTGNASARGSIEGRVSTRRGSGSGLMDGHITFNVDFDPIIDPELKARVVRAQDEVERTRQEAQLAINRMVVQSLTLEQAHAERDAAQKQLGQLGSGVGLSRDADPIEALGEFEGMLSTEERYANLLPVYGQLSARVETEERVLAQLQQQQVAAQGAYAAAQLELEDAEKALEAD